MCAANVVQAEHVHSSGAAAADAHPDAVHSRFSEARRSPLAQSRPKVAFEPAKLSRSPNSEIPANAGWVLSSA